MSYAFIGKPSDYDGDSPVWTLRFGTDANRLEVQKLLSEGHRDPPVFEWVSPTSLNVFMSDLLVLNESRWSKLRSTVNATLEAVHALQPLVAVVFCDTDGMSLAPAETLELYLDIRRKRGKARQVALKHAIGSGQPVLEELALTHAAALAQSGDLVTFAGQSAEHLERTQSALSRSLQRLAFDYGGKPRATKAVDALLRAVPVDFITRPFAYAVNMAAVRDVGAMRLLQAELHRERPEVHAALVKHWRASPSDYAVVLAFALADSDPTEALGHVVVAEDNAPAAKSVLWRKVIPAALAALRAELERAAD